MICLPSEAYHLLPRSGFVSHIDWRLAFESRRSIHSILMEGLDKVLAEHGTSAVRQVAEQQKAEQA